MGRPAGTPNRSKRALIALLQETYPGYHPVLEMAKIAHDLNNDVTLRSQMHKEVAQYVTPKLKAVEIDLTNHSPVQVQIVRFGDKDTIESSGAGPDLEA